MNENTQMVDLLKVMAGPQIGGAFERMAIVEEEIKAAMDRHPGRAKEINSTFGALCPTGELIEAGIELYRAHAREVLEDVAHGRELKPTSAQCCAILSVLSLRAPLQRDYLAAYYLAFVDAFGPDHKAVVGMEGDILSEWDIEQGRSALETVRDRLRQ